MIVALTPNLTLDRVVHLDRVLRPGELHRAPQVQVSAGGKGVNLARAVRAFGGDVCVAGVVSGFNGAHFRNLLHLEGLNGILEEGEGETRECHILLDQGNGHPTEIYEAGPPYAPAANAQLQNRLPAGQIVICGSLAPSTPLRTFREMLRTLDRPVVDSSGIGLEAALEGGAALIKPNQHELELLIGRGTVEGACDLYHRSGVTVLLTLGAAGAVYVGAEIWEAQAPAVEVRNPIGSGDTLLGAFLQARISGQDVAEALRIAVAAGSANAHLGGPAYFRADVARELASQVHLRSIA